MGIPQTPAMHIRAYLRACHYSTEIVDNELRWSKYVLP